MKYTITKEPIDLVCSRKKEDMLPYFYAIPKGERLLVKYLIADMYKSYEDLTISVFPNALYVIDSYHIVSFLMRRIIQYIASVKKPIRKDINELNEIKPLSNDEKKELINLKYKLNLLERYSWVILKNRNKVKYTNQAKYNIHIGKIVNTEMIINEYYNLNKNFKFIFEMKELYIEFNSTIFENHQEVENRLNELIICYATSRLKIFRDFAKLLKDHKQGIINSFTYYDERRLSNGPIESFNRKIKDTKRIARGYKNFTTLRKRILWSTRISEPFKTKK